MHQENNKSSQNDAKFRIIEAAIGLFARKGYASTSVQEIVTTAGLTKPVLYYYFKNKEGLFRKILDTASKQQEAMLAEILETPGSALDRLTLLYRTVSDGVRLHGDLFKMIHDLILGPPHGAPSYDFDQYRLRLVEAVKSIYIEGVSRGEVREADPEDVAVLVLSLIDYCFHLGEIHPDSSDPAQPERLLALMFQGLGRSEPDEFIRKRA